MEMKISASVGDWKKGAVNRPKDVRTVQTLLTQVSILIKKKAYHPKGIDGKIAKPPKSSSTVKAILAFQASFMNIPDGVVEPNRTTFKRLKTTLKRRQFPARPNFLPLNQSGRESLFGKFKYRREGNRVILEDDWAEKNIVSVNLPQLSGIPFSWGNGSTSRMRFHRLVADQLRSIWQAWQDAGLINRIQNYGGSYVVRLIRGSSHRLSSHSWGTAFDINTDTNGLGKIPPHVGDNGCVRELVQIANAYGFYWGGHFSRPDGMHFEAAMIGAAPIRMNRNYHGQSQILVA
jgi:hypothetical protein